MVTNGYTWSMAYLYMRLLMMLRRGEKRFSVGKYHTQYSHQAAV